MKIPIRTAVHLAVGLAIGLISGSASQAHAYTAIKRIHGDFCRAFAGSTFYADHGTLQRGLALDDTVAPQNYEAYCPFATTQDLELTQITTLEVELRFTSTTCSNATTVKACYLDQTNGSAVCGSSKSTTTDCNGAYVYTLTGSGTFLSAWAAGNASYPYVWVQEGSGVKVTVSGFKIYY